MKSDKPALACCKLNELVLDVWCINHTSGAAASNALATRTQIANGTTPALRAAIFSSQLFGERRRRRGDQPAKLKFNKSLSHVSGSR